MGKVIDELKEQKQQQFRQVLKMIGKRCRELRNKTGLNGRDFAELAGINHSTLVVLESGTANVSLVIIFMYAQAAGVDIWTFFEGILSEAHATKSCNGNAEGEPAIRSDKGDLSPEEEEEGK